MPIVCDHPRPKLDLPGYIPRRMAWQVPGNIPGLPPDAARVIRQALQGVYDELSRQGQQRNVIPLVEDLFVRPGSVVVGVGDGQTITLLPPGATGYTDPVTIILTDVEDAVNVVRPDGGVDIIEEPGSYDYEPAEGDYETLPGTALRFPGAPIYDVMDRRFGARGDGADDGAALNRAIAAANDVPGVIYLGNYHRTSVLLDPITANNVVIRGRGRFNGGSHIEYTGSGAGDLITIQDCQYSGVENVWLSASRVHTSGYGIHFKRVFRPFAERVLISQYGWGVGIYRCTLTDIRLVSQDDLYGVYGMRAYGDSGGPCHATRIEDCAAGTNYPANVVGVGQTWASGQSITAGNIRFSNGAIYQATTSGTTGSTAPSGIPGTTPATAHTATLSDGGVSWVFAMPLNTWYLQDSYAQTFEVLNSGGLQGGYGLQVIDDTPGSGSTPLFTRVDNLQIDHPFARGVRLLAGRAAHFDRTFITSVQEGYGFEVASTFGGGWQLIGGEIFGCVKAGLLISKGEGAAVGVEISACGTGFSCIEVTNSASNWKVIGCIAGSTILDTTPDTDYGINIGAGCDKYVVEGNTFLDHVIGPVLNTPGNAITRLVRNNVPEDARHYAADATATLSLSAGTYTLTVARHVSCVRITPTGAVVINKIVRQGGQGNAGGELTIIKEGFATGTIALRDTNVDADSIWTPNSVDYYLNAYGDAVRLEHWGDRHRIIGPGRTTVRVNSTGTNFVRRVLNFIPGTGVTIGASDDAASEEVDITIAASTGVTDGDKGDITVSSAGTVWTVDVNIAKTWTGVHSFTGASHTVDVSGALTMESDSDASLASVTGGLALGAGHVVVSPNVGNGDVVLNATSGIAINAHATTPVTAAATGAVEVTATTVTATASDDITLTATDDITVSASGDLTLTAATLGTTLLHGANTIVTATVAIGLNSPTQLNNNLILGGAITPTISGDTNNWNPSGGSGVVVWRANNTSGSEADITGVVLGNGQVVTIVNVGNGAEDRLRFRPENTSSTATNRLQFNTVDAVNKALAIDFDQSITLYKDPTTDRVRVLSHTGSEVSNG